MIKPPKVVFFQGTFDLTNCGHIRAFKLAKSYGDKLVVGLNTDDLIKRDKKRQAIMPYEQRKEILESIKYIDLVIPCSEELAIGYLKQLDADVFVLTKEWEERHRDTGIAWIKAKGGEVHFSPRFKDILCSTDLRNRVVERHKLGDF